jgi:hypothetical protein
MKKIIFIAIITLSFSIISFASNPLTDKEAVKKASMQYIEGFYEGDMEKLMSCLIPELQKSGFWRKKDESVYESAGQMTFQQALDFAKNVKEKKQFPGADAPKKVEVIEVLDKIAITKVTAWWGIDYMLLAKNDGKWMIRQILWEGPIKTANPSKADKEMARKAGLGYVEGFYEGDAEKLKESLLPSMYKFGYGYNRKEEKFYDGNQMTFEKALDYANKVKENKLFPKDDAPKKVEVLDVMNQTAAIKVTAWWGVDYMLLSKKEDKWMIEQVLWAGIPPKKD